MHFCRFTTQRLFSKEPTFCTKNSVNHMVYFSYYFKLAGDPDNEFSLDPSTGVIKLAKSLDYESKTQHVLTVKAADGGTQARETTTTVTINVLDANDNLPTCDEMSIVVTIPESRVQGDSVNKYCLIEYTAS